MTSKVLPLSGELNFMMTQWDSNFERSHLRLGHSQMQFGGTLSVNRTSNLQMEFVSEDLRDFAFLFPELKGSASFNGIAQGTSSNPNLSGSFKASHLTFQKFRADQINGQLEADPREVNVIHAVVKTGNSNVSVQGKFFLDPIRYFPPVNLHLLLKLKETSTEDLAAMIGEKLPASGLFSGDFVATGKYPQITVRGDAELHDGKFFNQPFDKGQFEIHYLEPILELPKLAVQLGTGILNGSAKVNLEEQTMTSILTGSAIPLDRIQWLRFPENPVSGQIRKMNLKAEGPFRLPSLNGEMDIAEIALAGEPVGDFRVKFQTDHQVLRITTESTNPSVRLKAVGSVGLNENLDLNAQLTFENLVLSPYVKKVLPVIPEKLTSQAEGQIVITGPLRAPEKLLTTGTLDSMRINFREAQLQAAKPFQIEIRNEKVTIKQALFTGKGTVLNLDGTIDLTQKKRLDLNMKGNFDLALLNEFVKKLSASGNGTVNAAIRGTLLDPRIQGQAQINNGQFSYADLPNSFSQLTGTLYFDENQIKVDNLTGSSGGGKVQVNGDLLFGQEMIKLLNLRIQGSEVRIRYPEKMRNVVDADLVLRGSEKSQLLSGNIRILSSSFQKGYDPITQYLENRSSRTRWPGARELGNMLSLDLTITGDRNIKLDTPLIKMSSRADLKVKGTAENPQVTGSIESSGGDIYFQGTRYRVTRGRLEFVNPVRIDPRIDLEAETDVRDYRVVLTINGTADKFRADLRSDPPLSTFDLFSLVSAGGTGLSNTGVRSTFRPNAMSGRQQDSSLGAATLLSEGLSLKMGSRVKRIFGLDRFRVDPFLVGNERDPSARVTFGQQVTKDVSVTYSTSLSSNEQQVILVEYNLNDSTSFIASRDAEGSFGLDVRFRKRLRQKHR
jgi:translocation and assembly module TamB